MYKVPAPKLQPVDNNPYKKLLFNPYLFSKKLDRSKAVQGISGICPWTPPLPGPASLEHPLCSRTPTPAPHYQSPYSSSIFSPQNKRGTLMAQQISLISVCTEPAVPRRTCYRQMIGCLCVKSSPWLNLLGWRGGTV